MRATEPSNTGVSDSKASVALHRALYKCGLATITIVLTAESTQVS